MSSKLSSLIKPYKKESDGPPDLDKLMSNFMKSLKSSTNPRGAKNDVFPFNSKLIITIVVLFWALSGIYVIKPAEQGVELFLGRYSKTVEAGPHWLPSILAHRYVVNVQKIHNFSHRAQMLTRDENIVDVALSVQYRVSDPRKYLFNVKNPTRSLKQATASAMRQVVGYTSLDNILTDGRAKAREQMLQQVRGILNNYQTGIEVTDLNLQPIKPPEAVTSAFDDAIKAREDEQRYINEARAYREKVVLIAQGKASRVLSEAKAFEEQVVLAAEAGIASYVALLPEHQKAPKITDFRLYTDALEDVFSRTRKILLEGDSRAQVMVWPSKITTQSMSPEQMIAMQQISEEQKPSLKKQSISNELFKYSSSRRGYSAKGDNYDN